MKILKRLTIALAVWLGLCTGAGAQDWPRQPITLVVAFAPGGSTDIMARLIAAKLKSELGQPVLVVNRPGAGGSIGASSVSRAAPDGYTLLLSTASATLYQVLTKNPPYNMLTDFAPVTQIAYQPLVLVVHKEFPAKTLPAFVTHVRESKGNLNYGSAGNGSTPHLAGALINYILGEKMTHVPYKGGSEAAVGLLGRQVETVMSAFGEVMPHLKSGELIALGVTTTAPSPALPDVPPIASALPDWPDTATWHGVMAPASTSPDILNKLNTAMMTVLKDAEVQKMISGLGGTVVGGSAAAFGRMIAADLERTARTVKLAGLSAQ